MLNTLEIDWLAQTVSFTAWIGSLDEKTLALRPAPGKWSVFETLEHIFIAEKGAARVMQGPSEPALRDLERSVSRMYAGLHDLTARYAGGPSLDPKGRFANYDEWSRAFEKQRSEMWTQANEAGLNELCTAFAHPYFGELTRTEWLIFCRLHLERHRAQMEVFVGMLGG